MYNDIKKYENHKAFNIHGRDMILCSVTYAEGSVYHQTQKWVCTYEDADVTCKHCLRILQFNPFAKRINASIRELKIA